eukprot:c11596_g1_i1.p1 GENE.c11596_g1_i1~~c11596_g1_i1.p1  ORF type:complete len:230 (+),score=46.69 c11596_g1_i1:113-802(+)
MSASSESDSYSSNSASCSSDAQPASGIGDIDCEIFFDLSSSMRLPADSTEGEGQTRFEHGVEAAMDIIADFCARDSDGITIGYYNRKFEVKHVSSEAQALKYFVKLESKIQSGTQLAPLLRDRFAAFRKEYPKSQRRRVICIVTDGATRDFAKVVKAIHEMTSWPGLKDDRTLGVSFLVVGDAKGGIAMCRQLDDDKSFKFDIVDAKPISWLERDGTTVADFIRHAFED